MTTPWVIRTTKRFQREIRRLDPVVQRRVTRELDAVAAMHDPRSRGKALTGELRGYWRYRMGDYRVIVDIRDHELCLIALTVGHRSEVYA